MNIDNLRPLDSRELLETALREQGEMPEDIALLAPVLQYLAGWKVPAPSPADTQRLLSHLIPLLTKPSPVRQALRARRRDAWGHLLFFVEVARAQVSILRPRFWLLSAFVTLLGMLIVFSIPNLNSAFVLRVLGPLLAYLAALSVFRGMRLGMLEFELSCPPSPQQLTLARLMIVLGYDVGLGLLCSLLLWFGGGENFLVLTLHWLMPLLLVTGLALLFSLYLPITRAAGLAYSCWLAVSLLTIAGPIAGTPLLSLTVTGEVMIGLSGLILLFVALLRLTPTLPQQLS